MRIKGDIIRSIRKQKKMSQIVLADDICTQGTISNIENKNVCDSIEILDAVCKRLNIELESILEDNDEKKLATLLDQVEELCNTLNHKKAYSLLNEANISIREFKNKDLEIRWLYFMGITNLIGCNNKTDSLFYFYRANELGTINSIYAILSVNSLGIFYEMENELDKARVYYEKSITMLENMTVEVPIEATKIYFNTAKFYSSIKEFTLAHRAACQGMNLNRVHQSLYMLDNLAYEVAYNEFMKSTDLDYPDFSMAKEFAKFNKNNNILDVIKKNKASLVQLRQDLQNNR